MWAWHDMKNICKAKKKISQGPINIRKAQSRFTLDCRKQWTAADQQLPRARSV